MSTKQRVDAEALRQRYARAFGIPPEKVTVNFLEDEDAEVVADGLPRWTLGTSTSTEAWNRKTGSNFR